MTFSSFILSMDSLHDSIRVTWLLALEDEISNECTQLSTSILDVDAATEHRTTCIEEQKGIHTTRDEQDISSGIYMMIAFMMFTDGS